jgi:hypothetical protein
MKTETKIIISENNFKGEVIHLVNDYYLFHHSGDEKFSNANMLQFYIATKFDGKLYDIGIRSLYQFKQDYNMEKAREKTLSLFNRYGITGKLEDFFIELIRSINSGGWIYSWLIPLLEKYDKENKTDYHKKAIENRKRVKLENERKQEEEKKQREEKEEQEREKERIEKEKQEEKWATVFNGFLKDVKPMRRQKIYNVLSKIYRYNGERINTRAENVLICLEEGYTPHDNPTKPGYVLMKDSTFLEVTKTEWDYANYLIEKEDEEE